MSIELYLQNKLAKERSGKKEVKTPLGRIDILTNVELIEIKEYKNWKNGIGQLISYSKFHPGKELCLYLFGEITSDIRQIQELCHDNGIKLQYDSTGRHKIRQTRLEITLKNNNFIEYLKNNTLNECKYSVHEILKKLNLDINRVNESKIAKAFKYLEFSKIHTNKGNFWIKYTEKDITPEIEIKEV